MNIKQDPDGVDWIAVIGRSLAYLSVHTAGLREEDLVAQAEFLTNLGLSRKEAASLLGSSENSLKAMRSRARKKNGKNGKTKK